MLEMFLRRSGYKNPLLWRSDGDVLLDVLVLGSGDGSYVACLGCLCCLSPSLLSLNHVQGMLISLKLNKIRRWFGWEQNGVVLTAVMAHNLVPFCRSHNSNSKKTAQLE